MIDSHAHVAFRQFNDDREAVVERARIAGVRWLEVGTDLVQSRAALELARQFPQAVVGATVGVHPSDAKMISEENWREFEDLLAAKQVLAVGEVGLDYFRGGDKPTQLPSLERFVKLAVEKQKPVIFHVRDGKQSAHDDLIQFLANLLPAHRPEGVIHTFSGTRQQAEGYLKLGLYLSFSGVVTFKNAGEVVEVSREMPLDKLLIETDCPFLAPDPFRGQRNEPAYVQLVAEKIAGVRGMALQTIKQATAENTRRLLGV